MSNALDDAFQALHIVIASKQATSESLSLDTVGQPDSRISN